MGHESGLTSVLMGFYLAGCDILPHLFQRMPSSLLWKLRPCLHVSIDWAHVPKSPRCFIDPSIAPSTQHKLHALLVSWEYSEPRSSPSHAWMKWLLRLELYALASSWILLIQLVRLEKAHMELRVKFQVRRQDNPVSSFPILFSMGKGPSYRGNKPLCTLL